MNRRSLGNIGEDAAAAFLENKGWRIVERNWRKPWGEIDLVCRDDRDRLVFVEVKAEKRSPGFIPEQHIDERKKLQLQRLVKVYLLEHPKLRDKPSRIDVAAVDTASSGEILEIRHHEGAVQG